MKKIIITPPAAIDHGNQLALAAICIAARSEQIAGQHDGALRNLFEDAVDLLQRHAKRCAMQAFDESSMQARINERATAK